MPVWHRAEVQVQVARPRSFAPNGAQDHNRSRARRNPLSGDLVEKAQTLRDRLAGSEFDASLTQHNGNFVASFAMCCGGFNTSGFDLVAASNLEAPAFNGINVPFTPTLLAYRKTQANTHKIGALMYCYAKGKPASRDAAEWQTAFMYGLFSDNPSIEEAMPKRGLW
jgi:hypothetical protein